MSNWLEITTTIAAVATMLFAGIKLWIDMSESATIRRTAATFKRSVWGRNGVAIGLLLIGVALLGTVLVQPLPVLSVLLAAFAAMFITLGVCAVLLQELLLRLLDRLFGS